MPNGIVYILTNPSLDGWIKIGMTDRNDINARLAELNAPPNIPLSYRAYALYEVENPHEVEQHIHNLFDVIDESLHAREMLSSGRVREREFFRISPEKAYAVFKSVAMLRNDLNNLKLIEPSEEQAAEVQIAEQSKRRPPFKFTMLNIPVGTELKFLYDENIVCYTKDIHNRIEYEENEYSLSGLATKLLVENYGWLNTYTVQGTLFFTYQGSTLNDLRTLKEQNQSDEQE